MRIYIVGAAGSGKTTLAKKIQKKQTLNAIILMTFIMIIKPMVQAVLLRIGMHYLET